MRSSPSIAAIVTALAWHTAIAQPSQHPHAERSSLNDVVGVWRSDTVGGAWARSVCAPSPLGAAVICEQDIHTPGGARHAVNMFLVDSVARRYVYYGVTQPGEVIRAVPLAIADHVWAYGGGERDDDGLYHRTINDFSSPGSYLWRQESSRDGVNWVAGQAHGRSVRER